MQQYLATFDSAVDPNATTETFNIRLPDGTTPISLPVDITAPDLLFAVDDPTLLQGAMCFTVDSNNAGAAPQSPDFPLPVPPPPVPPAFSRAILNIVPVDVPPPSPDGFGVRGSLPRRSALPVARRPRVWAVR